jgi:hypothetical protein
MSEPVARAKESGRRQDITPRVTRPCPDAQHRRLSRAGRGKDELVDKILPKLVYDKIKDRIVAKQLALITGM